MINNNPKWTGYFKVIEPAPLATKMTDSQSMSDSGAYNNFTWYQRLIQGSASRMTRYREYDLMDNDIEVARALDTIAEEMTGNNPKTKDPLEIDLSTELDDTITPIAVLTLKAALRRFNKIHDMKNRLYRIARVTIKYGDIFFRRQENPFAQWEFIHPKNVVAAIVDAEDATKIVGWQVKTDAKKPRSGGYSMPLGSKQDTQTETEIVSARTIIRFGLTNDMSDTQPFGESVLRPVYRAHKQKELLEDAVIIYRIQRAPERRVFYIDVGKMPPQRVKQYLENIKNEIKQKKVPTLNGGQSEIDSVYNPQSMCLSLDTKIPLLDGRTESLSTLIQEFDEGKENWVYSIDPKSGEVVPGPISWAGITQRDTETIKMTLDNGDEIVCTPEHKFPVQSRGFVEAKDLTYEDRLWSFDGKEESITTPTGVTSSKYRTIYDPTTKSCKIVHRFVELTNKNIHRVVKIEKWVNQDVGTLTIDKEEKYHSHHTFALTSCFTKNSEDFFFAQRPDGRGSKVETLPGGQGLGELADLEYFQRKVWRGLKVPVSYMIEQQDGGQIWNDGKVGIAYIQELRFSLYVERLQAYIEKVVDTEFKRFLRQNNIQISEESYELKLPEPSNYGKYRQYEIDSQLLSSYGSADGIVGLSTRFKLKRFLQITDEELKVSEYMKCEELGLDPTGDQKENVKIIYSANGEQSGMGGFGGGLGGGFGGGLDGGMGGVDGGMGGIEPGMEAGGELGNTENVTPNNNETPNAPITNNPK